MTEAINAHKKMAMGMTEGNVMKKGGAVKRYASGGAVKGAIPESRVANLPTVASRSLATNSAWSRASSSREDESA